MTTCTYSKGFTPTNFEINIKAMEIPDYIKPSRGKVTQFYFFFLGGMSGYIFQVLGYALNARVMFLFTNTRKV